MNIWYIHPYAGGPGIGRYWRPYYFSKYWNQAGHNSVVISAAYHHLLEPDDMRQGRYEINGAQYAFVPTLRYQGNGKGRMMSMALFSIFLLPYCLLRAFQHGRPDAIIYSSPHPFGFISAWLAARLLRAKCVFEVRDIWPLSLIELGGLKIGNPLVKITGWIEKFAYRRVDKVISLLPCAEAHMLDKGLEAGKFLWVPNGVDKRQEVSDLVNDASSLVQHVKSLREQGQFIVMYAGAHGEPNALEGFIRSAEILHAQGLRVRLILVGKGERKSELQNYAVVHSEHMVDFFDQQPKETVMAALRLASAGYISLKAEPIFRFGVSPNKLWDYMLEGLPVIFACKAGNDPVGEFGCGLSTDPDSPEAIAQAITELYLLTPEQRVEMGLRGHQAVMDNYMYEHMATRIVESLGGDSRR